MCTNSQFPADLSSPTKEIINKKLQHLCGAYSRLSLTEIPVKSVLKNFPIIKSAMKCKKLVLGRLYFHGASENCQNN